MTSGRDTTLNGKNNMIFQILFFIIAGIIGVITSLIPGSGQIPLLLPFGIDPIFVSAITTYKAFAIHNWPLVFPMAMAVIYIAFEGGMLFLKLLLGHRAPGHS